MGIGLVAVTFSPSINQNVSGTLTAANLGPGGSQTIQLFGTGFIDSELTAFEPCHVEEIRQEPVHHARGARDIASPLLEFRTGLVAGRVLGEQPRVDRKGPQCRQRQ